MSLPRYPEYKDSRVEWLGEVPAHWEVKRLKYLCDIQTGDRDTENAVEDGLYPFFVRSQTVERINSYAFDGEAILTAGDGVGVGKVFHHYSGAFDFHQRVYMLNRFQNVSGAFLFHYLRENFYKVALEGGAKSTVDSLRRPLFTNFPVALPPPDEQLCIVDFATQQTAKIDALVAEQQRLIELLPSQKVCKPLHQVGLVLLVAGGCVPGYQDTPYPPCFLPDDPDPACHAGQAEEGATAETATPTTGTPFPNDGTDSGGPETGADEVGASSGESTGTTGPEVQAEPVIVGMSLTPGPGTPGSCVLDLAGPVAVTVQTEAAVEVWITVDDGEAVALDPVGDDGTEFVGEIAVLGESWNGSHTVSAVAESGELVSAPWVDMFSVTAPAAGSELWKKKSTITPSKGNAVAVDAQGEVYELFTEWSPQGARCHVRRRDTEGEPVWPQDAVALAAGVSCGGEDIEVAPDGTIWALANTVVAGVNRWQLFHLDPDGVELDAPQVGDFQEFGRGLDVNAGGDLLLCGVRPGLLLPDAWVRLSLSAGKGWTVPWVYQVEGVDQPFDERTRDCAFVEDRIVVVGEVFGTHDKLNPGKLSRGSVVEFGLNGARLSEAVATDELTLQSGYEAIAPDGDGGYVAVGYTCDVNVTPCTPTQGIMTWFSPGASLTWAQPVTAAATVWGVAASPSGGVVVAAEALIKGKGFLAQAWAPGKGEPSWEYQGTLSTLQVATGIAVGPFGYISVGGFFLDGDTLAAGVVTLHPY